MAPLPDVPRQVVHSGARPLQRGLERLVGALLEVDFRPLDAVPRPPPVHVADHGVDAPVAALAHEAAAHDPDARRRRLAGVGVGVQRAVVEVVPGRRAEPRPRGPGRFGGHQLPAAVGGVLVHVAAADLPVVVLVVRQPPRVAAQQVHDLDGVRVAVGALRLDVGVRLRVLGARHHLVPPAGRPEVSAADAGAPAHGPGGVRLRDVPRHRNGVQAPHLVVHRDAANDVQLILEDDARVPRARLEGRVADEAPVPAVAGHPDVVLRVRGVAAHKDHDVLRQAVVRGGERHERVPVARVPRRHGAGLQRVPVLHVKVPRELKLLGPARVGRLRVPDVRAARLERHVILLESVGTAAHDPHLSVHEGGGVAIPRRGTNVHGRVRRHRIPAGGIQGVVVAGLRVDGAEGHGRHERTKARAHAHPAHLRCPGRRSQAPAWAGATQRLVPCRGVPAADGSDWVWGVGG
mmetsp:Transcript_18921/g.57490  ORF Transcript_18921/g.57490 Transcript_18921/m.57490 type:complete len:462 (+) Transcript_18921:480-1865(+)